MSTSPITDAASLDAQARGLMAFWASIRLANQAAYQRWHNNEHIPERVGIEGFLAGRRYRSTTDDERFLMYYDTAAPEALVGAPYLAALNRPTPRTTVALRWFEDPVRSVYRWQDAFVAPGAGEAAAPVLVVVRHAAPVDVATRHAPLSALAASLGARRIRRYSLDGPGSKVATREASIHQADPGSLPTMLMIETLDLALMDDAAAGSVAAQAIGAWTRDNGISAAPKVDIHSLEFALDRR